MMKFSYIYKMALLTLFILILSHNQYAQGIDFIEEDLVAAKAEAAKEDKLIFVDAYASWCGPCKRMAKKIFPQKKAGDYFNKNFINLKLNMEKGQGKAFRSKYKIRSYPTLLFITSTGKIIQSVRGARDVKALLALGRSAVSKSDFSATYKKEYDAGNRDYDLVYNYVKALNKANKPSSKIANDYLKDQHDLSTPGILKFILLATTYVDSKIFDMLIDRRSAIAAVTSQEEIQERIVDAGAGTAAKAIEFESVELLTEAIEKATKYAPSESSGETGAWISNFFGKIQDEATFIQFVKGVNSDLSIKSRQSLVDISLKQFATSNAVLDIAEQEAKTCCKAQPANHHYHVSLAKIHFEKKEKKKALKAAKNALKVAQKAELPTKEIEDLIMAIKEM